MILTRRYILESFSIATVLTVAILAITHSTMDSPVNWVETASVFFSFACTWLCTRQVRFNYVLAVISTSLLAFTFWQAGLYGSMVLNLYLIPTVIYGWFIWGRDTDPRPVEHVQPRKLLWYLLFTALTWAGALGIISAFGGHMAALDGWLLVGTVLAQFLLDRKKLENWFVWMAVNVVSIYVYFSAGLYLLAAQFLLFFANAVFAWFQWRRSMAAPGREPQDDGALPSGVAPCTS